MVFWSTWRTVVTGSRNHRLMALTQKRPVTQALTKQRHRPLPSAGLISRRNPVRKAVKPVRGVVHEDVAPRMSSAMSAGIP